MWYLLPDNNGHSPGMDEMPIQYTDQFLYSLVDFKYAIIIAMLFFNVNNGEVDVCRLLLETSWILCNSGNESFILLHSIHIAEPLSRNV